MTDADLSRQLALALGYAPESVRIIRSDIGPENDECQVFRIPTICTNQCDSCWLLFEYTDPSVCLPLLAWLAQLNGSVHIWPSKESWDVRYGDRVREVVNADTLEEAVARAVIAVGVR